MGGIRASMLSISISGSSLWTMSKPLTLEVWLSYILLWFLYGFALFIISKMSKKMCEEIPSASPVEEEFTLFQAVWAFSLSTLQYGADKNTKSLGAKILQFYWCGFTIFFTAIYTANLVAFLSNEPETPLQSVEDIGGSERGLIFWRVSNDLDKLDDIVDDDQVGIQLNGNLTEKDAVALKKWLDSGKVLIAYDTDIDFVGKYIPNLYKLEGYLSFEAFGFAVRKNWAFADQMRGVFVGYGKRGYFNQLYRKFVKREVKASQRAQSMNFENVYPVVIAMLWGMGFSIIVTFLSIVIGTGKRKVSTIRQFRTSTPPF